MNIRRPAFHAFVVMVLGLAGATGCGEPKKAPPGAEGGATETTIDLGPSSDSPEANKGEPTPPAGK